MSRVLTGPKSLVHSRSSKWQVEIFTTSKERETQLSKRSRPAARRRAGDRQRPRTGRKTYARKEGRKEGRLRTFEGSVLGRTYATSARAPAPSLASLH